MTTFLLSLLVIMLVFAVMAIGVMSGRAPLKGSCGGIGALGIDTACEICGGDPQRCDEQGRTEQSAAAGSPQYYRANRR